MQVRCCGVAKRCRLEVNGECRMQNAYTLTALLISEFVYANCRMPASAQRGLTPAMSREAMTRFGSPRSFV